VAAPVAPAASKNFRRVALVLSHRALVIMSSHLDGDTLSVRFVLC